ncbi:MAG: IS4 family transposase [Burkholderiales bacterium]
MHKKMTREGRLRKPSRRTWPAFLRRLIPDSTWRGLERLAEKGMDPRTRWSPKLIVLCWVMMGWSIQGQLTQRFREGRETLSQMFYRRRRCGESYQGLTLATQRTGASLFHQFWHRLRETVPKRVGSAWTWYGWTVFAVDGSRIDAPRTRRNEKALGKSARDKSHPQWWITRLIHLPTKMMWDWRQGPGHSSERAHLREMMPSLPKDSLLVGDIGFGGFDLLWQLSNEKAAFVIRCGGNSTLLVDNTRQEIERQGDVGWVYLWPQNRRRKKPLRLRLIVLKDRRQRVYLLTNVEDTQRLSRRMAGEFYRARWGIEVEYRGLKQTLGRRKVLARTPEPGAMELAANILAMALLLLYAALAMGAKVTQLSLAQALRAIRWAIEALRHGASCASLLRRLREAVVDEYERRSSKRARDWPHKKNERPPDPPRLRRLSRTENARIERILMHHTARVA